MIVYDGVKFFVERRHGNYYMYHKIMKNYRGDPLVMATIHNVDVLETKYSGSFEKWYDEMRKQRTKTINSYLDQIEGLKTKIEELEEAWDIEGVE